MITEKTARHIAVRNRALNQINCAIENMGRIVSAKLELSFGTAGADSIPVYCEKVSALLQEMKAYEKHCLDELNTLAVQEAQND